MARYVDGYVLPIPKKHVGAYRKMASTASKVWRDHGALEYRECLAEQLDVPFGTSFAKQMKLKPGETVVFAWVVFKSRAHRDGVNGKVMKDPCITKMMTSRMPFDPKRMLYAGFNVIVEA